MRCSISISGTVVLLSGAIFAIATGTEATGEALCTSPASKRASSSLLPGSAGVAFLAQVNSLPADAVSGKEQPNAIPDEIVLSLYIKTLLAKDDSPSERLRIEVTLASAGFSPGEATLVLGFTGPVGKTLRAFEAAAIMVQSRGETAGDPSAVESQLADLDRERSRFLTTTLRSLDTRLGRPLADKLRQHLKQHVKPNTVKLPKPADSSMRPKITGPKAAKIEVEGLLVPAAFSPTMMANMFACLNDSGSGIAPYCADTCGGSQC